MRPILVLRHADRTVPLTARAVWIGRSEECGITLEGAQVSRRHARIVPTPEGSLLVDSSRFGTWLNGAQVVAPSRLEAGDVIRIGTQELLVELGSTESEPRPGSGAHAALASWRRRYRLARALGAVVLVLAALLVRAVSGSLVLAALAGSLAEAGWLYGVLLVREWREERGHARVGGCAPRPLRELGHDLLAEFGAAERVDRLLVRPFCLWLGLFATGGWVGLVLGKLAADLLFYGPLRSLLPWRTPNTATAAGAASDPRRRPTTATGEPFIPQ